MAATRGESAFLEHYATVLPARWPVLLEALRAAPRRVLRKNAFAVDDAPIFGDLQASPELAGCYEPGASAEAALGSRDAIGLRRFYVMDPASVVAARALRVVPGSRVLDLCAAPGGKALVLAEALAAEGELVVNDRSKKRLARLKRVLADYVPRDVRERIALSCRDGKRLWRGQNERYDAILVDAPCSSERHVLGDASELAKWSRGRIKRLSVEQFALLSSAFVALKPGGRLVYSTCALLSEENDDVVERLLKRRQGDIVVEPVMAPFGTRTRFGWQIWPDVADCGPIYFSCLFKGRPEPETTVGPERELT